MQVRTTHVFDGFWWRPTYTKGSTHIQSFYIYRIGSNEIESCLHVCVCVCMWWLSFANNLISLHITYIHMCRLINGENQFIFMYCIYACIIDSSSLFYFRPPFYTENRHRVVIRDLNLNYSLFCLLLINTTSSSTVCLSLVCMCVYVYFALVSQLFGTFK